MTTAVSVINHGLAKLAASRVSTISPPKTNLERYMADNYPLWRDEEFSSKRWRSLLEYVPLTLTSGPVASAAKPNAFLMPNAALRPVREKSTEWEQRGRYLFSAYSTLTVQFIMRKPESSLDPLLLEVLACKVATESCEYVTQSNVKVEAAEAKYDKAVRRAASLNAFVTGAEEVGDENDAENHEAFSFITSRWGE